MVLASLSALVALASHNDSADIKWSPKAGQEWTYEWEFGFPGAATSWFFYNAAGELHVRIESVTDEQVTMVFTQTYKRGGIGKTDEFKMEPQVETLKYNLFGEPIGHTHLLPNLRNSGVPHRGFTFPNRQRQGSSAHFRYQRTSWAHVVEKNSQTPLETATLYEGVNVSTFLATEKIGEIFCWKIGYRSLGVQSENDLTEGRGEVWLDSRDGSVVQVIEGERPEKFDIWDEEVLRKMSSYCIVRRK